MCNKNFGGHKKVWGALLPWFGRPVVAIKKLPVRFWRRSVLLKFQVMQQ